MDLNWNWVKEGFEEPTGGLSWGRLASSVALVAVIVWVSRYLAMTHTWPSTDIIKQLTGFTLAPYGTNKAITAVQAFSRNPVGSDPTATPQPPQV